MTTIIPLTQGYSTVVDDEDADLAALKWSAMPAPNTQYAIRVKREDGHRVYPYMHRVIMERMLGRALEKRERVDHEDRNGLNNCRSNLRLATHAQNMMNARKRKDNTSGYKGVCWSKRDQKWIAAIRFNNTRKHLGSFDSAEEAYTAYCNAAEEYHGEFARFE